MSDAKQRRYEARLKRFERQLERWGEAYTIGGIPMRAVPTPDTVQADASGGGGFSLTPTENIISVLRSAFDESPQGLPVQDGDGGRFYVTAFIWEPGDPEMKLKLNAEGAR